MRIVLAAAMLMLGIAASAAEPPPSLTQYRCYICHSDYEAGAGPSFIDVAAAYRAKRAAVATIADRIRAGVAGGGPWHMPPHPEISPDKAKAMARYIMSLPPRVDDVTKAQKKNPPAAGLP